MRLMKNESGYTLLEMIITIGLIGIAIGMSGFGLRTVFNSNLDSVANEFANEVRLTYSRELAASNNDYSMILSYDSSNGYYKANLYVERNGGSRELLKTIKFSKAISIMKDGADVSGLAESERSFEFDQSSGKLLSNGEGTYTFTSSTSTMIRDVIVVKDNGRVYVDE